MKYSPDDKKRVFLDLDSLTQWDHHIAQRFPQPEKVPIVGLEPGPAGSWDDAQATIFGGVIKEEGLYRMWYWGIRCATSHNEQSDLPAVCYGESDDGIHWRKPDLKITGQNRYPGNNLLAMPGALNGIVRALPGTPGGAKYLATSTLYAIPLEKDVQDIPINPDPVKTGGGTYIWASEDGFHWRPLTHVMTHGDNACLFVDRPNNRYLLHNKVGGMHGLISRRMWIGVESTDGVHWEGYKGLRNWRESFVCDDYDDLIAQQRGCTHAETYAVGLYRAGEIIVSMETIFDGTPPLHERFSQNPAARSHTRLGFSHDGYHFRYPKGRPEWLPLGKPGEFDSGWMMPACTLTEDGDDLLYYYGGSPRDHDWCLLPNFKLNPDIPLSEHRDNCRIMMARMKRDRFASLAAVWRGNFDVDADFRKGDGLTINAQALNGQVRVALAEKSGPYHGALRKHESLPGFSFDDCIPITGDHVAAPVRFRNAKVTDIRWDTPLTVRFELNQSEVFAYDWTDAPK